MFTRSAPKPDCPSIDILRCPTAGKFECLALDEPFCIWTHFYRGRTYPCPSHDCPLCVADFHGRMYSYTPVNFRDTIRLLELPQAATYHLNAKAVDGITGRTILVARNGRRQNSPVTANPSTEKVAPIRLPSLPDVRLVLLKIWSMPFAAEKYSDDDVANHVRRRLRQIMDQEKQEARPAAQTFPPTPTPNNGA